jgi:rhamnulokinase
MAVQWIASGAFKDIWEARSAIRSSFPITEYEPQLRADWTEAYQRFMQITAVPPDSETGSGV